VLQVCCWQAVRCWAVRRSAAGQSDHHRHATPGIIQVSTAAAAAAEACTAVKCLGCFGCVDTSDTTILHPYCCREPTSWMALFQHQPARRATSAVPACHPYTQPDVLCCCICSAAASALHYLLCRFSCSDAEVCIFHHCREPTSWMALLQHQVPIVVGCNVQWPLTNTTC
jgi:hypothetical protein